MYDFLLVLIVTLGQQYHVGEKPAVTQPYISRHAGTPFTVFK